MPEVTLQQMLTAREERAARQQRLLEKYGYPVVCFTMNIAGPVKTSPLIERAFRYGCEKLLSALPATPLDDYRATDITGCEWTFSVNADPDTLKKCCITIEEEAPIGRLFDMDVIDQNGKKIERATQRGCIVCGANGRGCAASRRHSVEELQIATAALLTDHFFKHDAAVIAELAVRSLIEEVDTTPKPGLVDRRNNGSHADMDRPLFYRSAESLREYFYNCFAEGHRTANHRPDITFIGLRSHGMEAERRMFEVTNGINTHKGAIYSFGVLCGALGRLWNGLSPVADVHKLLAECPSLVHRSATTDFADTLTVTAGKRCYHEYGLKGVRGEAESGFSSVANYGLPAFESALNDGLCANDAGVYALLRLIAHVGDTALYHRGGADGAAFAAEAAKELLESASYPTVADVEALDDAFIKRNLSPGGCADLLAVTYFLYHLYNEKTW